MRLRDTIKLSLEMMIPERWTKAAGLGVSPSIVEPAASRQDEKPVAPSEPPLSMIKVLDQNEFGGPSFGPETLQILEKVFDEIKADSEGPLSDEALHRIASAILKAAAEGERDAGRLKEKALTAAAR